MSSINVTRVWAFQERVHFKRDGWVWWTNEVRLRRDDARNDLQRMFDASKDWKVPLRRRNLRVVPLEVKGRTA